MKQQDKIEGKGYSVEWLDMPYGPILHAKILEHFDEFDFIVSVDIALDMRKGIKGLSVIFDNQTDTMVLTPKIQLSAMNMLKKRDFQYIHYSSVDAHQKFDPQTLKEQSELATMAGASMGLNIRYRIVTSIEEAQQWLANCVEDL